MIIGIFALFILMSTGYAAFQTFLNINVSGHVYVTPDECFTVSDNGDGTGSIINYNMDCGKKVVIPDVINGLTITKIADYSETSPVFYNKAITYVKLPNNLSYIGTSSFRNTKITEIKMPESLRTIGGRSFQGSLLKSVNLNYGLETLNWGCFENANLVHLSIPSTVKDLNVPISLLNHITGDEAFVYKRDENGVIDYTTLINHGNGKSMENVTVPEGVAHISDYCFYGYSYKSIILPETVREIENTAFYNVGNLKTLYIGKNIENIDRNAFKYTPSNITININRRENSISGAPWGATDATINWIGNT